MNYEQVNKLKENYYKIIEDSYQYLIKTNEHIQKFGYFNTDTSDWSKVLRNIRNAYLNINKINQKYGCTTYKIKPRDWWKEK